MKHNEALQNPRVIVIQKLYSNHLNNYCEIVYHKHKYKKLIKIRKENSCLRTGSFDTIVADGMLYGFLRADKEGAISVVINNDTKIHKIKIPINSDTALDLLTEKEYVSSGGFVEVELNAMSGIILKETTYKQSK